jgi:hypothetical protein
MADTSYSLIIASAIADLATRLAVDGLAIYSLRYDYLAFGSWELVAGRRLTRVRIVWGGKDGVLETYAASLVKSMDPPQWQRVRELDFSKKRGNHAEIFGAAHVAIREHAGV